MPSDSRFRPSVATNDRLKQFRGARSPLPLGDKRVLVVLVVHICFLPWAFGTTYAWSQLTSLALAITGFAVALWRGPSLETRGAGLDPAVPSPPSPVARLLKFPLFWIGLALLVYLLIQASNPSWRYFTNGSRWWVVKMPNYTWLPTSVEAPFARFNIWRQFIIYASAWLTLCTVAIGLSRRRSYGILLTWLSINGLLLMLAGIMARLTRTTEQVLWFEERHLNAATFSSFIYKNHAAAYLALVATAMLVLAARYRERALREHSRSSPALLGVLGALLAFFAVVFSGARGGALLLGGYLLLAAIVFAVHRYLTRSGSTTPRVVTYTIVAMVASVLLFVFAQLDLDQVLDRFGKLADTEHQDASISSRIEVRTASGEMFIATWPRGVGAGGFRYVFPQYVRHYPASYRGGNLFWQHAHIDWLEIPIELGLVGSAIVLAGGGWWCWRLGRRSVWRSLPMLLLSLGLMQTLVHAAIDFPFQNPAVLITWLVLAVVAARYLQPEPA